MSAGHTEGIPPGTMASLYVLSHAAHLRMGAGILESWGDEKRWPFVFSGGRGVAAPQTEATRDRQGQ